MPTDLEMEKIGRAAGEYAPLDDLDAKLALAGQRPPAPPPPAAPDPPSWRFAPREVLSGGLKAAGNILWAIPQDIGGGIADIYQGRLPTLENVRSAGTDFGPTPAERDAAALGPMAELFTGVGHTVKSIPTLATGELARRFTGLPPEVIYPLLFGEQAYQEVKNLPISTMEKAYETMKAGTVGLIFPLVGRAIKPVAGAIINRLGLVDSPNAQRIIELGVDQALMQSASHLLNTGQYLDPKLSDEQKKQIFLETTGSIAAFSIPRALGYARGAPSEYEHTIQQEAARIGNYFDTASFRDFVDTLRDIQRREISPGGLTQSELLSGQTETTAAETAAAMRAGLVRATPTRGLTLEQRRAEAALETLRRSTSGRESLGRSFNRAVSTPFRRIAAEFAQEELGTPVGITQPAAVDLGNGFSLTRTDNRANEKNFVIKNEDGAVVGNISLSKFPETGKWHVSSIGVPLARGEGLGRKATLSVAGQLGEAIYSDASLSESGRKAWEAIATGKETLGGTEYYKIEPGGPSAVHETAEGAVRTVQLPGGTTPGAGQVPEAVGGAETGARGSGAADTASDAYSRPTRPPQAPSAAVGDIVELYGYIGELGKDEQGRLIVKTDTGIVEVPEDEGLVHLRLAVTPGGKIIRNGKIYEPAVGGGKPWQNAYNPETGRLKIREVGGNKGVVYLVGPSADYIVSKLNLQAPAAPRSRSLRVARLPEKVTDAGLAEGETRSVDTPVDEYILSAGIAKETADKAAAAEAEVAARKAASVTLRNNIATPLGGITLEKINRKAANPHTGEFFTANIIFNPRGPASSYLDVRGPRNVHSYKVPLSALPEGSYKTVAGGIEFDKRAVLAFLSDDARRLANRNTSNRAEWFTPQDIDTITGRKVTPGTGGRPGLPGRRVRIDQPTGSGGESLETALKVVTPSEAELNKPITGILRRIIDGIRDRNPELFKELYDKPYDQLDEAFWNKIKTEIMQLDEVRTLPNAVDIGHAADATVRHLQELKVSGRFRNQAIIQGDAGQVSNPDNWEIRHKPGAPFGLEWTLIYPGRVVRSPSGEMQVEMTRFDFHTAAEASSDASP